MKLTSCDNSLRFECTSKFSLPVFLKVYQKDTFYCFDGIDWYQVFLPFNKDFSMLLVKHFNMKNSLASNQLTRT